MTKTTATFKLNVAEPAADISDYVWTPTKDESGVITDASWAGLPLNTWVEVADTAPVDAIYDALIAGGFTPTAPFGTEGGLKSHIRGSFIAWTGGCLDSTGRRWYLPIGGGHSDGALNGIWQLDLDKIAWGVRHMPSNPQAPGFEWTQTYIDCRNWSGWRNDDGDNEPDSLFGDGYYDTLPDGKPTSTHQYRHSIFDAARNRITTQRFGQWRFDLDTDTWSVYRLSMGSETFTGPGNGFSYHDPVRDIVFGCFWQLSAYWTVHKLDLATDTMSKTAANMPSPGYNGQTLTGVYERNLVFIDATSGLARILDMDAETWATADVTGWDTTGTQDSGQVMHWIPSVAKFLYLRHRAGRAFWIDPATWTMTEVTFQGKTLPTAPNLMTKQFYDPVRKCVIVIPGASNTTSPVYNVFVMRMA